MGTAPELVVKESVAERRRRSIAETEQIDEAIAAVERAENSSDKDPSEVVAILAQTIKHLSSSYRLRLILEAHGWNGTEFNASPNFRQLLQQLQLAKSELVKEVENLPAQETAPPAKQGGADEFEDEYEDEFVDASADSLNMSRTLKAQEGKDSFEPLDDTTFEHQEG